MSWFKSLGYTELILIGAFVILYGAYLVRMYIVSQRLGTGFGKVVIKLVIRSLYFALLIVALLGPSFGESTQEIKSVGKDIYIAVDLSASMNAFDVQPSRLEKVKFELKKIVSAFNSDRLGLIIFSSEAFVQCPLTYDQSALNLFIETLHTNLVESNGTDFTPALNLALEKLSSKESTITQQKSKVILLISDGEDFGDTTRETAELIEARGIKLFTLGVGTSEGSTIVTRAGVKRDRQGKEVISKLNAKSLKDVATLTDGKYFEINSTKNDVNRLISTISEIEGELRDTRIIDVSTNKYYYFLGLALIFMLLDFLIRINIIRL
ncbi:MAG: VWA domain-containing protein [Cyclobacteriaceae bacterium]|nr:VWA domain-containing protein [Cyclobacteriaceae bacterium]